MNTIRKSIALASLATAGLFAAGAAQAHTDVQFSINLGGLLPAIGLPAPVIVAPAPVVVAPGYARRVGWDRDHDGIPNRYDRHDNRFDRRGFDHDRDGVPNRWDRNDHNPRRY